MRSAARCSFRWTARCWFDELLVDVGLASPARDFESAADRQATCGKEDDAGAEGLEHWNFLPGAAPDTSDEYVKRPRKIRVFRRLFVLKGGGSAYIMRAPGQGTRKSLPSQTIFEHRF
jgi:hypothetical protein